MIRIVRKSVRPEPVEGLFFLIAAKSKTGLRQAQPERVCFADAYPYVPLMASPQIDALTQALARLPGLGPRSARRAVLHLMKRRQSALEPLLAALSEVAEHLSTCSTCGNVDTSDPCSLCRDPRRDDRMLCVVEEVSDLWALDRSRLFPGRYHVLGGRLSALEGVRPEDLGIDTLVARVAAGGIDERHARRADHRALPRRAARQISRPPDPARPRPPRRRRTRLSRRGHTGPSDARAPPGRLKLPLPPSGRG